MNIKGYPQLLWMGIFFLCGFNTFAADFWEKNYSKEKACKRLFLDENQDQDNPPKTVKLTHSSETGSFFSSTEAQLPLAHFSLPLPDFNFSRAPVPKNISFQSNTPSTPKRLNALPSLELIRPLLTDRFDSLEKLGSGNQASVFKARDIAENKWYALKVFPATNYNGKKLEKEYFNSRLLIKNKHIISYLDKWKKKEFIFILTNLFSTDLNKYLAELTTPIEEDTIWNFITDIILGLHELEKNNFVHRDIKPENLFMDEDGRLVLGDLGMMVKITGNPDIDSEEDFDVGDKRYAAKEFLTDAEISISCDSASFGFTLLEVLSGFELPKEGDAWLRLREKGGAEEYLQGSYSEELKQLVRDLIDPKPANRPIASQILKHPRVEKILHERGLLE